MLTFLVSLLLLMFFNALYIVGFYRACEYSYHPEAIAGIDFIPEGSDENGIIEESKMILWQVRHFCLNTFGDKWSKPVCTCISCMASLHSILPFCFYAYITDMSHPVIWYIMYVPALSALAYFINNKSQ